MTSPVVRQRRSLALVIAIVLSACGEATAPDALESARVSLTDFTVPASAPATDTVTVAFAYENSCGPRTTYVTYRDARIEIEVRAEDLQTPRVCLGWLRYSRGEVVVLPSQRAAETAIVFLQPGGADVIRVLRVASALEHAP